MARLDAGPREDLLHRLRARRSTTSSRTRAGRPDVRHRPPRAACSGPTSLGDLEDLAWHLDEPFGDSSAIPTYMVSQLAARAREGGAVRRRRRRAVRRLRQVRWSRAASGGTALLRRLRAAPDPGSRAPDARRHAGPQLPAPHRAARRRALPRRDHAVPARPAARRCSRPRPSALVGGGRSRGRRSARGVRPGRRTGCRPLQYFDLHGYLPLDILTKVDRMSMAHSIEARVPLLDHKLVEFAATIPPELQLQNGERKAPVQARDARDPARGRSSSRPSAASRFPSGAGSGGRLRGFVHDLLLSETSLGTRASSTRIRSGASWRGRSAVRRISISSSGR